MRAGLHCIPGICACIAYIPAPELNGVEAYFEQVFHEKNAGKWGGNEPSGAIRCGTHDREHAAKNKTKRGSCYLGENAECAHDFQSEFQENNAKNDERILLS